MRSFQSFSFPFSFNKRNSLRFAGSILAATSFWFAQIRNQDAQAFTYLDAIMNEAEGAISHPGGYYGTGGPITITVGIDKTAPNAQAMATSVRNVVDIWNGLVVTNGNFRLMSSDVGPDQTDFESVLLHEFGHALGLGHTNVGPSFGVESMFYTNSLPGNDGEYIMGPGLDGIVGTQDDEHVNDVNVFYFQNGVNDPYRLPSTIDSSTYTRSLSALPKNYSFPIYPHSTGGHGYTEAVMTQGIRFPQSSLRSLSAEEVAALRFANTGLDTKAGTADDYTIILKYVGFNTPADIIVTGDSTNPLSSDALAETKNISELIPGTSHYRIISSVIRVNSLVNYYFNPSRRSLCKAFHNWVNPYDVDGDSFVSPLDVLLLVNTYNGNPYGNNQLPATKPANALFIDVDNDNYFSPLDVLTVINFIDLGWAGREVANIPPSDASGEATTFPRARNNLLAERAKALDTQYKLTASASLISDKYKLNYSWNTLKAKFMSSNGASWFYILPDGRTFSWGGSFETSTYRGQLSSDYYKKPELLYLALENYRVRTVVD